jgi:F-type H+-transporting ATPase subunit delta
MSKSSQAASWARAILEVAVERGEVVPMGTALVNLAAWSQQNPDLRALFSNPLFARSEQHAVLRDLAAQAGWSATFRNVTMLLADRRRLSLLPEIARSYGEQAAAADQQVPGLVRTAVALTSAQLQELERTMAGLTGQKVVLSQQVDPTLIGGLQVSVAGRLYDTSIRAQLEGLRQSLTRELQ